jgi:dTMP kinase
MTSTPDRGTFVVLEGIDGAGTTTQATRLAAWLEQKKISVELTREPTSGPAGALIQQALQGKIDLDEKALALLFAADRIDHLSRVIEPALAKGSWIVSDRYVLSSLAYQSVHVPLPWVRLLNQYAPWPEVTFLLDAPVEVCLERIRALGRPVEHYEKPGTLQSIRENYQKLAEALLEAGQRIIVLDATEPVEAVNQKVVAGLELD